MIVQTYIEQKDVWPSSGKHILAQYDEDTIVVYQAYSPAIAEYAVSNQRFGGPEFSYARMSWIKTNFLWMMFRSGWAVKPNQERILAVRIKRTFFDELLQAAVISSYDANMYATEKEWKSAAAKSDVRLQWDPDHHPKGNKLERRAIQLGIRGAMLTRYGQQEIVSIEDITPFVEQQRIILNEDFESLLVAKETVYEPTNVSLVSRPI